MQYVDEIIQLKTEFPTIVRKSVLYRPILMRTRHIAQELKTIFLLLN